MIAGIAHLARNLRAGFVLAREGALVADRRLGAAARRAARPAGRAGCSSGAGPASGAARLSAALTRLGPSYVKFGQFLATRPDIVGVAAARDLESLQDRMPPFPRAEAVATVEAALGRPIGEVFVELQRAGGRGLDRAGAPGASRSTDGRDARHQGDPARRARALRARPPGHGLLRPRWPSAACPKPRRLRPSETVEILARSVTMETDLRLEAAALSELAENTEQDDAISGSRRPIGS